MYYSPLRRSLVSASFRSKPTIGLTDSLLRTSTSIITVRFYNKKYPAPKSQSSSSSSSSKSKSNMAPGKASNAALTSSALFDVSHVTALVTGGATGIGLMITQALVTNGAKVYITSRREEVLQKTAELYSGSDSDAQGKIIPLQGDVSDKEDCKWLADEVTKLEPNGIQLLVNNAGIARDDSTKFSSNDKPDFKDAKAIAEHFWELGPESWAETFKTNTTGYFYMSMAFLPLLAKGGEKTKGYTSQIINVSSMSGQLRGSSGGQFAYACSKAATTHLSRMLATTFVDAKVRVNIIAPGVFPSEMTTGESDSDNKSVITSEMSNPAGRPGKDTDMAATVLFLAGKGGVFYNEQTLFPDGGMTLIEPTAKA